MSIHTTTGAVALQGGIEGAWRRYEVDDPKALVVLTHGLGEHGGRYAHVARHLADNGYTSWVLDLRGHGLSGGRRGHVMSFDQYAADVAIHVEEARKAVPGVPWFLLGHSMGALVVTHYCQTHTSALPKGLALSSPLFQVALEVPKLKAMAGRGLSRLWPTLSMPSGLDASLVSRDPAVVAAYTGDPLVHDKVSARWFTSLEEAMPRVLAHAPQMKLPVLLMAAGADGLVSVQGAHRFFDALGSADKKKIIYEDWYHEIFNEPQREQPLGELTVWLDAHLKG